MNTVVKQLRPAFTIEKRIPIPPRHGQLPMPYSFMDMVVGDSFFLPGDDVDQVMRDLDNARRRFGKANPGYRFQTRRVPAGARCWRTK